MDSGHSELVGGHLKNGILLGLTPTARGVMQNCTDRISCEYKVYITLKKQCYIEAVKINCHENGCFASEHCAYFFRLI